MVVIGYDWCFLVLELVEVIVVVVWGCELEFLFIDIVVFMLVCSWVVVECKVLGVLVIIVSYNLLEWLGLKIKGFFGGLVEGDFIVVVE